MVGLSPAQPIALVCGITGQDGGYLAENLIRRGYHVVGTTRRLAAADCLHLEVLRATHSLAVQELDLMDADAVNDLIADVKPDHIYHLSSMSSVGMSFGNPQDSIVSNLLPTTNLLEALRTRFSQVRLFVAGSSEVFGNTGLVPANEAADFRPVSPYGIAKCAATQLTALYRDLYNLHACTGILFNHESIMRPDHFVSRKITKAAVRIASGSVERLVLGNIAVVRDWGWAPDYVDAFVRMLEHGEPLDFVIATGRAISLAEFTEAAFEAVGLNWCDHVDIDSSMIRPGEPKFILADPGKVLNQLGWAARISGVEVARELVRLELERGYQSTGTKL